MTAGEIILTQLGGGRFIAMTGASGLSLDHNSLRFALPARAAKNRIRYCIITLAGDDTYDMEFGTAMGVRYRLVAERRGIYCDQLEEVFTTETGLYTRL